MYAYLDLYSCFYLFCIVQGITTAVVLFSRDATPANRWLAWLLIGLTCQVIDYLLSRSGVYYRHRWLYFLPLFYSWSFGPLLYGYIRARANQPVHWRFRYFLPVLVQTLFYVVLTVQSLDTKAWFWLSVHKPYTRYIEHLVACLLVLYALYRSRALVTNRQLTYLLTGLGTFYVIAAIDPFINYTYLPPDWPRFYLTALILPLFVYGLALFSLLHTRWSKPSRPAPVVAVAPDQRQRVREAVQLLYKEPDLSLATVAQHLGNTPNAVSHVINNGFNQSFNEFVNVHRVDEVKRRIATGDANRLTILALAFEAGFSSKTTFNRVFKEQTGHTPQQYIKLSQLTLRDDAPV